MYKRAKYAQQLIVIVVLLSSLNSCYSPWAGFAQPTSTPEYTPDTNWSSEQLATALYSLNQTNRLLALKYLKERGAGAAPAVPALINILRSSPSVDARAEAYNVLGSIGPEAKDAVPVLIEELKEGKTRTDKLGAAAVLGTIGPGAKDAIPILIRMGLDDSDDRVRSSATESLGKISFDKDVLDFLISRMGAEKSGEVQIGISRGLCAMGTKARPAVPYLAKNLWWGKDDHDIKQIAAKAISTIAEVEFYDNGCAQGGFKEFINGELRIVLEARTWWTNTGQYQKWLQP